MSKFLTVLAGAVVLTVLGFIALGRWELGKEQVITQFKDHHLPVALAALSSDPNVVMAKLKPHVTTPALFRLAREYRDAARARSETGIRLSFRDLQYHQVKVIARADGQAQLHTQWTLYIDSHHSGHSHIRRLFADTIYTLVETSHRVYKIDRVETKTLKVEELHDSVWGRPHSHASNAPHSH